MSSFPGLQDYFEKDDVLFEAIPWAILKTDKLAGYMAQVAVIGHKCDQFDVVQFMDEEDCLLGVCWWCKEDIPEAIQGMWQMLNWENIPKMRQYDTEEWESIPDPFVKNHPQVAYSDYKLNPPNNSSSCFRNPKAYKNKTTAWGPCGPDFDSTGKRKKKMQSVVGRHTAP